MKLKEFGPLGACVLAPPRSANDYLTNISPLSCARMTSACCRTSSTRSTRNTTGRLGFSFNILAITITLTSVFPVPESTERVKLLETEKFGSLRK